jgi:3-dehydroquinate dehydratase-2
VINPAAYTHTSVAVRDALLYSGLPAIEVHLTNPASREEFRKVSLVEDVVVGRISGVGGYGYTLALLALLRHLRREGARGRA